MRLIISFLLAMIATRPCLAWSEAGHHLISVMTYKLLSEAEQEVLQTLLAAHPRFASDFVAPKAIIDPREVRLWTFGRAENWPNVVSQPQYDRPFWRYEVGATLKLGSDLQVPPPSGPLPANATLNSQNLHLGQAAELCRNVLKDKSQPNADRAFALCWLTYLVAEAHQPCNAGSLYMVEVFPLGDHQAAAIPTRQAGNLHSFWDSLLGKSFDAAEVRRHSMEIEGDHIIWTDASDAAKMREGLDPQGWLSESMRIAKQDVYDREVMAAVEEAAIKSQRVAPIELSPEYIKSATRVARKRAAFAAHRLAAVLRQEL